MCFEGKAPIYCPPMEGYEVGQPCSGHLNLSKITAAGRISGRYVLCNMILMAFPATNLYICRKCEIVCTIRIPSLCFVIQPFVCPFSFLARWGPQVVDACMLGGDQWNLT